MKVNEGQEVLYQGKATHVETIINRYYCIIANPDWDWDDEGFAVEHDLEYNEPYWITVKISELKPINKNNE